MIRFKEVITVCKFFLKLTGDTNNLIVFIFLFLFIFCFIFWQSSSDPG